MDDKKYLKLNDIEAYKSALQLSNYVWEIIVKWSSFNQDTVGKQFVRAIDSVSANIAEGFGRYGKKDKINFYRYARASAMESLDWNEKSMRRKIIDEEVYRHILGELQKLPKSINTLIKVTDNNLEK